MAHVITDQLMAPYWLILIFNYYFGSRIPKGKIIIAFLDSEKDSVEIFTGLQTNRPQGKLRRGSGNITFPQVPLLLGELCLHSGSVKASYTVQWLVFIIKLSRLLEI